MAGSFWVETLGCPKNQVDSDKLVGTLLADGLVPADEPRGRRPRRGQHLRLRRGGPPGVDRHHPRASTTPGPTAPASSSPAAWPSATATSWPRPCPRSTRSSASACRSRLDGRSRRRRRQPSRCPRSTCSTCPARRSTAPWAYVKVAEGCDRACGFCAIPSFRGKQRSRTVDDILDEVDAPAGARRSCSSPRTSPPTAATRAWGSGRIVPAGARPSPSGVDRVRLLYLYPSDLTDAADRRHAAPPACPTSTSRSSTCRPRCCGA